MKPRCRLGAGAALQECGEVLGHDSASVCSIGQLQWVTHVALLSNLLLDNSALIELLKVCLAFQNVLYRELWRILELDMFLMRILRN